MANITESILKPSKAPDMIELEIEDPQVLNIMKALSSRTRWNILKSLKQNLDICQTAKTLKQTEANISAQVKILEKANLIVPKYEAGRHGIRKFSQLNVNQIIIKIQ